MPKEKLISFAFIKERPMFFDPNTIYFLNDGVRNQVIVIGDNIHEPMQIGNVTWDEIPGRPEHVVAGDSPEDLRTLLGAASDGSYPTPTLDGFLTLTEDQLPTLRTIENNGFVVVHNVGMFLWEEGASGLEDGVTFFKTANGGWRLEFSSPQKLADVFSPRNNFYKTRIITLPGSGNFTVNLTWPGLKPTDRVSYTTSNSRAFSLTPQVDNLVITASNAQANSELRITALGL